MNAMNLTRLGAFFCFGCALFSIARAATDTTVRRVEFREPHPTAYLIANPTNPGTRTKLFSARDHAPVVAQIAGATNTVEISSRLVLKIEAGLDLNALLAGRNLALSRTLSSNLFILQAADSLSAIEAAESLAARKGVLASYPVMRRPLKTYQSYAPRPEDPLFPEQWHLENRGTNKNRAGVDLNARAAWPAAKGAGVTVAVVDNGFQLDHPELTQRAQEQPHYNFYRSIASGAPASVDSDHGTAVAGLVAAEGYNQLGVVGVAPQARLASWVIFGVFDVFEDFADDEEMMDMYQYASNRVDVQNHSWGYVTTTPVARDALADLAIENAVARGRGGRGVIMARAGGNERSELINANDDAYLNDPRVIAVAAARIDGRATSYSNPGACLLVAAPSGDTLDSNEDGFSDSPDPTAPDVLTTDRTEEAGYNVATGDTGNYAYFNGTSASTPQIAGVAALLLSANPALTYRDVQQILALSARHYDLADPDARRNGAGLRFSHNLGFGVPDAGFAVELAKGWSNRPPASRLAITNTTRQDIPDDGLRVVCSAPGLSNSLASIRALPSFGPHPDDPTPPLPLVYVGQANETIAQDLNGKAALIQRGNSYFWEKIDRAARAGAAFAIIFNDRGTNEIQLMGGTAYVPIPAVSIGRQDGEALRDFLAAHPATTARLQLTSAVYRLNFPGTVICEHVGLRLKTTHSRRADVRVTLVSPMGTRSVLQAINNDQDRGPRDWTYWSTQHFFESSAGEWRLEVSDQRNSLISSFPTGLTSATGAVTYVELMVQGVLIEDADGDALSDSWEQHFFAGMEAEAAADPDGDGFSNAFEQVLRTHPLQPSRTFRLELAELEPGYWRISWPGREGEEYAVQGKTNVLSQFNDLTILPGQFPVTEHIVPAPDLTNQFFRVRNGGTE